MMFWRGHDRARWMLTASLALGGVAFVVSTPNTALYARIDRFVGVKNLSTLAVSILFIAVAAMINLWILYWSPEQVGRADRRILAGTLAVMALLTALFLAAPDGPERPMGLVLDYSRRPLDAAFTTVFLVVFTSAWPAAAFSARRVRARARRGGRMPVVYGLRAVAVAMWTAGLYAATQDCVVVGASLGTEAFSRWSALLESVFATISSVSSTLAGTCRTWGPRLERLLDGLRAYTRHRRLQPLFDLVGPDKTNSPAPQGLRQRFHEITKTAAYRTVQIRDAVKSLSPYRSSQVARIAASNRRALDEASTRAFVEACVLLVAVENKTTGKTIEEHERHPIPQHSTLSEAADFQMAVTRELRRAAALLAVLQRDEPFARGRS